MTKLNIMKDIIKEFYNLCDSLAVSNDSPSEETIRDYFENYALEKHCLDNQYNLLLEYEKFRTNHILNANDEWRKANVDLFIKSKQ